MNAIPLLDSPCQHIHELLKLPRYRSIIALAGLPGSGKSTYAEQITNEVNGIIGPGTMISLGMDGFHLTKAELAEFPDPAAAFARRGAPWTFDIAAMASRLDEIRDGAERCDVYWPDFQHGTGDPVADTFVVSKDVRIVLIEGLYLLYERDGWESVSKIFDERWFLDVPLDVATERLILRHTRTRNISRAEAEERVDRNDRLNALLILPTFQHGDCRVQ